MINQNISHYKIIEKLGSGGMGIIYKAEDLKLNRTVALKVLSESFTYDEESKQRFIFEAQSASSLQHNNICTIHEIDETSDGHLFIVMDYYEGETLKKRISRESLGIEEIIGITTQIAEGLNKAHKSGIIHRDIKPSNIFITNEGIVKILDFGLAKKIDRTQFTRRDVKLGTTDYMSPEQIKGEKVDHRTDIWSLGTVIYEMLTGEPPFKADYEQAIIYLILNQEPEDVKVFREDVPERLTTILESCVSKDKEDRYEDLECLLEELKNIPLEEEVLFQFPVQGPSHSIAVLPFVNMSTDPDQEFFCDGLTEELINSLSKIQNLKVVARTSAFSFKGESYDVRKVGRKLGVTTVLEGSIRKSGNQIRITAQLINVLDGFHLWSEKYERELQDIFKIQDEISLAIVNILKVKLLKFDKEKLVKRYTDNIEAYNLYLQGLSFFNRFNINTVDKTIEYFNKALEKDPNYALGYYGLAGVYFTIIYFGIKSSKEAFPYMRKNIYKALELDKNLPELYNVLGLLKALFEWKQAEADAAYRHGLELNPNNALILINYSMNRTMLGEFKTAKKLIKRALLIDPLSDYAELASVYPDFCMMKFELVVNSLIKFQLTDPPFWMALWFLWRTFSLMNKKEQAVEICKKSFQIAGRKDIVEVIENAGIDNAFEAAATKLAGLYQEHYTSPYDIATLFMHAGKREKAVLWLERSLEVIDPKIVYLGVDPDWKSIRNIPLIKKILNVVGLRS